MGQSYEYSKHVVGIGCEYRRLVTLGWQGSAEIDQRGDNNDLYLAEGHPFGHLYTVALLDILNLEHDLLACHQSGVGVTA